MSGITASSFWTALSAPSPSPDNPRREILLGSVAAAVFFVGLCGWAAFARMDAATNASGVVVVSGHRQSVQSRDGGIVSSLRVKEGDHVQAGQVLVEFAPAEAIAEERALTERVIGLKAQIARLEAEQMGAASITAPAEFASLSADDKVIAEHAMALEAHALASSRGADAARRGTLNQRQAEAEQQIIGYQRQLAANARQQQLNADELKGMKELAARATPPPPACAPWSSPPPAWKATPARKRPRSPA